MSSAVHQPSLYLLDAHALIFQVFHAIAPMSSPGGLPTNALFGFTRDLVFLRTEVKPDYLVCAFDRSEPTFRETIYPEYKANRGPMPDDLRPQIEPIHQLLAAMRIPVLDKETFEADDVIATVATAAGRRGMDVFICSSDKDCRQLLSERIRIYNLRKREVFDRDTLLRDWGVTPEQVVDLQTLVGDAVDNVPGVEGIGLKTAAKLLQEYQTLDNLMAHVDEVAGPKRRENLKAAAGPLLETSRTLVRLRTDVPLTMDWESWKLQDWDAPRLLELFSLWGFHRFANMVRPQARSTRTLAAVSAGSAAAGGSVAVQGDLFAEAEESSPASSAAAANGQAEAHGVRLAPGWQADYHLVNTPTLLDECYSQLRQQQRFAVDLETTDLQPRCAEIVGFALCWRPGEAWYLPVRGPVGDAILDEAEVVARLRLLLEDPAIAKVNQNIKYDLMVLRQQGIHLAGVAGDSMVADYLLHAGERNHNMQSLARTHLRHEVVPITELIGKGKKQRRMDEVPTADVSIYSGEDADVAWRLCDLLEEQLRHAKLEGLYRDLEVPLIEVLAELEFNGIRVDVPRLKRLGEEMAAQLARIEDDIYRLAGHEFNIASLAQLRQVLFDELKLPVKRKTGITGKASTDQETLEWLADQGHALPKQLVEHRKLAKLKGTYVDALPELVNPRTGRVHASFNQTVAATGRLSSSDPNLQNIPVRSEQGGQIRQAFVPEEGWLLLTADYSQIELRLLAHFSGDAELCRAFAEDRDIHAAVAAQVFGVPESEVTSAMRRVAKTVNFGVIYGMSAFGLGQRLHIEREQAAGFIKAYFERYPKVMEYQQRLLQTCRAQGYVSTILGQRRAFDPTGIRPDSTYEQRSQAEREAINMEIQGSAADLIKAAMLNVYRRLKREQRQGRMLLQIHDELVFEVPADELQAVAGLVADEMTGALGERVQVPLKVDMEFGPNWLETAELKRADAPRRS